MVMPDIINQFFEEYRVLVASGLIGSGILFLIMLVILINKKKHWRKKNELYKSLKSSDVAEETSVLENDFGETCLLSDSLLMALMIRKRTGERIEISKQIFRLGKVQTLADYCILGNTNISRLHATVLYRQGAYYIVDEQSTNGTYLNGSRLNTEEENLLRHGDNIRLADEDFEFYEY